MYVYIYIYRERERERDVQQGFPEPIVSTDFMGYRAAGLVKV